MGLTSLELFVGTYKTNTLKIGDCFVDIINKIKLTKCVVCVMCLNKIKMVQGVILNTKPFYNSITVYVIYKEKKYTLRFFPKSGKIHIPGCTLPNMEDAKHVTKIWLNRLKSSGYDIEHNAIIPILQNYKCKNDKNINVHSILLELINNDFIYKCIAHSNIDDMYNKSHIYVQYQYDIDKKIKVMIYPSGKVTFWGGDNYNAALKIYDFINSVIN